MSLIDICRICLLQNVELKNIFSETQNNEEILKLVWTLAQIEVTENDGLPATICTTCLEKLTSTIDLKAQIVASHKELLERRQEVNVDSSEESFACNICGKRLSCSICDKRFTSVPANETYSCSTCDQQCPSTCESCERLLVTASQHWELIDSGKRFTCILCKKGYRSTRDLARHMYILNHS